MKTEFEKEGENKYVYTMVLCFAFSSRYCFAGTAEPFTKAISCDSGTWYSSLDCMVYCAIQRDRSRNNIWNAGKADIIRICRISGDRGSIWLFGNLLSCFDTVD